MNKRHIKSEYLFDPESKISQQFIKGLKEYNLTLEEIQNGRWKYAGGDTGSHRRYFNMVYGEEYEIPIPESKCVCSHGIVENCYITNGELWLTLGNCCIKRFLPKGCSGRTCGQCGKPHKNQKNNLCNDCRLELKYSKSPYCIEKGCKSLAKLKNGERKERCASCFQLWLDQQPWYKNKKRTWRRRLN